MITVKRLEESKLIEDACALLYRTMLETANWEFLPDNPSQLRVETKNNRRLLIDRFTDNAVWFGAFDESTLVGCIRVTFVDENDKLEIEGYKSSRVIQEYIPSDKKRCVELTRTSCLHSYNGLGVLRHLFLSAFKYCHENQYSVCGASSNGYIINLFEKIGFPLKIEHAFKYEKQDPSPVNFYFADYNKSEIKNIISKLESYEKDVDDNTSTIFEALEIVAPILPTLVYWHDTEGTVLGLNALCLKGMGVTKKEQVLGKSPYEFYPKDIAEHILEHNNRVMKAGEVLSQDEQIEDIETGKVKIFRSTKAPLYNDKGKIIGIIGSSIEVTNERQAEALKAEFIENMQHDIRTPISGIYSLLDAVNKSGNMEEFKKYLPHILNASRELLDIHNAVIDFENHEYGDKPIYNRKFSLLELLHSIIHLNSAAALAHKSTLALEIGSDVPDVVKGDNYRVSKILINLIANAIKFTENGKVSVQVKLINQKNKQATIRFVVEDNGIGIPEEKIPTIFEKFTRLNPSNRGKFKGSGLGLHMVSKFIDEIGAELDVKSVVNEGTIFAVDVVFELPLVQQLADEDTHKEVERTILIDAKKTEAETQNIVVSKEKESSTSTATSEIIRVCLIEDSPIAMIAAENILSKLEQPCHIEKAINVTEAKDVLARSTFDIVVCDLGLPDGTGFDIITAVKKDKNHLNYVTPFVALTAHSDDARREQAKKLGFLGFYNKPLTDDMAKKIIVDHLANEVTIIDIIGMTNMFGGNEKTALEMVNTLIFSFKDEKILFKDAFMCNDYTKARALFHKFRGGISYIMAPELSKVAMLLHDEVKAFEREDKPLTDLITQLNNLFKSVDDIEHWLNSNKTE